MGAEAQKLFNEAQVALKKIIADKSVKATGIVGFYPANSVGDDIEVYEDETRSKVVAKFHGLRQQAEKDPEAKEPFLSLSDFIAPKETGIPDYVGLFACSAGFGSDELVKQFKAQNDDYNAIMVESLADRLAEAFAEKLHEIVRKDLWGYSAGEQLGTEDLIKIKYQGIRPAPGYPSQPDHTEKATMWKLANITEQTGISLTESFAMWPAASVSGLYFAHPQSSYFAVGKISKQQVEEYAVRKGEDFEKTQTWLQPILNYD